MQDSWRKMMIGHVGFTEKQPAEFAAMHDFLASTGQRVEVSTLTSSHPLSRSRRLCLALSPSPSCTLLSLAWSHSPNTKPMHSPQYSAVSQQQSV